MKLAARIKCIYIKLYKLKKIILSDGFNFNSEMKYLELTEVNALQKPWNKMKIC